MWKMTFTTIPKVTFCWQTKTCLSGALSSSHQQDAKLEEADPRQHRPLKHSTPFTVSMICSGTVHAQLQHKGRQPGLLSCLSFNWSDKPARPRYFRDGTVLLSIARRWVGKAVCVPHHHVPMHLQPPLFQDWTLPGKALPITAGCAKLGGFVMWADVYKGPERGQTNTYCDLSLKETRRAGVHSSANANTTQLPRPHTRPCWKQRGRQVHSAGWEKRLLGVRNLLRRSLS